MASAAWMVLLVGAVLYVDTRRAEPFLSMSDVPGGTAGGIAGALVVSVAGWIVIASRIDRLERAEWQETGQQAELHPADDGDRTELTGTVDGRTVTARYEKQKVSGSEGSTGYVWLTLGDAALAGPAEEGLVVGTAGGSVDAGIGNVDFEQMAETVPTTEGLFARERDGLFLAGTSQSVVAAVDEGLSGDALRAIRDLNVVAAGDAAGVVRRWAEAHNEAMEGAGSSLAEFPVDNLLERVPGDAGTVTVETRGSDRILDGEDLRRFTEGVVAIADAFEAATDRSSHSE